MNDTFENRVRAAAMAWWWTLLIGAGFLAIQWVIYLLIMSARPAWLLSLWGPDVSWQTCPECLVLGHGDLQALLVAAGPGGSLTDAVGAAVAKAGRQFIIV
jgi:hypothetical protein